MTYVYQQFQVIPEFASGSSGNVYTTQSGMTGYTWAVSSGGTITSGQGTNTVTVTWNTAGTQTVSVTYTNSSITGCALLRQLLLM